MHRRALAQVALLASGALLLAACAQDTTSASSASPSGSASCTPSTMQTVTPGTLTIGTDTPAYPPYFVDNTPSNGKGFESAVAYAVAKQLGYTTDQIKWVVVPFNNSYAPGVKNFDFDINQISITPERAKAVDFSNGYYTVNQAVVSMKNSSIANAKSIADLQGAKLGAQVGTTSLSFITDTIKPTQQPYVYNDTNGAITALKNGTLDGLVVDLPTAYYITAAQLDGSKIVGQFKTQEGGNNEQFGMVFTQGNPIVGCVNQSLGVLKSSGDLQKIQDTWLAGADAPYLTQ